MFNTGRVEVWQLVRGHPRQPAFRVQMPRDELLLQTTGWRGIYPFRGAGLSFHLREEGQDFFSGLSEGHPQQKWSRADRKEGGTGDLGDTLIHIYARTRDQRHRSTDRLPEKEIAGFGGDTGGAVVLAARDLEALMQAVPRSAGGRLNHAPIVNQKARARLDSFYQADSALRVCGKG